MGWMLDLYETYEENKGQVGKIGKNRFGTEYALLPVSHVYQTAQVEVNLDFEGNFVSAEVIPKEQGNTIIPCTIDSSTRSSGPVPHPLHDKLMYVAGDFVEYGGTVKKGGNPYHDYLSQLKEWCDFDKGNRTLAAIYKYLKQGHLIKDLVAQGVLHEDGGKLIPKWTKEYQNQGKEKPEIFKVLAGDQLSAFVRFTIFDSERYTQKVWENPEMFQSFIDFYQTKIEKSDLCYVTGIDEPVTDKHASKIRYGGDMAKLISGNDNSGFTFRGRFSSKDQVATIGYDASQKSHNALKWLIAKQGQTIDGRVFLTWGKKSVDMVDAMDSFLEYFAIEPVTQKELTDNTHSSFAKQFRQAISGYQHNLDTEERVSILVLDAATPGRMSVVYYQNFEADLYLERIKCWHESCSWRHAYRRNESKEMTFYYGAPTNREIAKAAYGSQASDQIIKNTMSRLLPSIVEGRPVPRDIVQLLVNRSSRPQGMEEWEWERTLTIACSMVKKYVQQRNEGVINITLNKKSTDRSYLFGRMLAVADVLERDALASQNEQRTTNAKRYMTAFSQHPMSTWQIIQEKLLPYQEKLSFKNIRYDKLLDEISKQFDEADLNDNSLNGKYLVGYYSQRQDMYTKAKDIEKETAQKQNEEVIDTAVNKESTDRNYLFGRMLAVADLLERRALTNNDERRITNARRYMTAFSQHPMSTWRIIQENLLPYQTKLGSNNIRYDRLFDEIAGQFDEADFDDKPLNGKYLIGYYNQRYDIYTKANNKGEKIVQQKNMLVNQANTDRNYLFGRMLAIADVLEKRVLINQDEERTTNARRYMTAFSQHPKSTWQIIRKSLRPYQAKLGAVNMYYEKLFNEIIERFGEADFNDKSLNGKYLIGYYSQRQDLYTKNKKTEEQD